MDINLLPNRVKNWYLNLITPAVDALVRLRPNPNFFTTIGFLVSLIAGLLFANGFLKLGGILVLLSGTLDIVDGRVARSTGRVTRFGALYDSSLDRYAEVIVFFGLAYYFVHQEWTPWIQAAVSFALGGSIMVSYVRARAEGLGFQCKVGLMQRPERIVALGLGALIHKYALIGAIVLIALLANVTAIQRLWYIWAQERRKKRETVSKPEVEVVEV